jgi:DNA (cytosine-5)-methyltransferase 1
MARKFVQTPTGEAIDLTSNRYGRLWRRIRPGNDAKSALLPIGSSSGFGSKKLDPNKPAMTIAKMMGTGFAWMAHWSEPRTLTTVEAQILSGFPRDFVFTGDFAARWARIGNCVPPPLMRAIASHVRALLALGDRMPTVISTFSGCGGSSLGYKLAGCKVRLAVEWDADAVETYKMNFPTTPVYHGDIADLSADRALELAGLKPGELDIFDGSPPCQGFSTMRGVRNADDKRNRLFEEYARLLRGLRPKAFIMENVKGMVMGEMKPIFEEVMSTLRACGYRVKARVLNAKWYGVPQSRERVIFIGFREDLGIDPTHPEPTVTKPITVGEALAGCPVGESFELTDRYGKLWRRVRPGQRAYDELIKIGVGIGFGGTIKLDPRKPSRTIVKMQGGKGFATLCHWAENRSLSTEEAQRLGGFPDSFKFTGDYQTRWARIGNCVPPPLMRAVAAHVSELLERG